MGRVTYQAMAEHWPSSSDAYAAPMNDLPKVVFSKTLEKAEWKDSLGCGLPLFKDLSAPIRLNLVEATTYQTGAALHVYRPTA
jgi:dihydrofolate reductase